MAPERRIDIEIFKIVVRSIAGSDNLETMSEQMVQLLAGTLGIKGCTIFILNPETEELESLASFGLSLHYVNKGPVVLGKSMDHRHHDRSIVVQDVDSSEGLQYPENARAEGIRAIVSLPIRIHGRLIGALRLYHFEPWEISAEDLDSLAVLADIIGLSMNYSRLLTAMQGMHDLVQEIHPVWLFPDRG